MHALANSNIRWKTEKKEPKGTHESLSKMIFERTKQFTRKRVYIFYSARYRTLRKHEFLLTLAPRATFFTRLWFFFFL